MGKVREYNFVTGIETSTIPDPGTPSAASDTISLGFINDQFYWAEPVDAYADIRALTTDQRVHNQRRIVDGPQELWYFDENSTSVDDGATILKPNDLGALDPGRWLIDTSGGGGGGGGGGGSGIEQLAQKAEMEKSGIYTEQLDNSVYSSGVSKYIDTVVGRLLKDTTSGASALEIVWSPIYINDSDKDFDSTSGWSVQGAGATLTTSGTKQIGTASLSFDKNNTSATASIRYDRGAQNLGLGSNTEVYFYINLPSITNLTDVFFRVYKDSTSNYRTYLKTADIAGTPLAVGWNLIKVDLINDSGTNTGSGWTYTDLSRYVEIGVNATIAQTYTAILVDSLMFSVVSPQKLGLNGQQVTIYNNSVREEVIIDGANTRYAGRLTLAAVTTNSFNGGTSAATASGVQRITMSLSQYVAGFDSTLSSGNIATTQELRLSRKLRESISGDADLLVDLATPQFNEVSTVGVSTIGITDPSDLSANYANGNTVDVIRPMYTDGDTSYRYLSTKTLTAGSSHSSGVTTLTVDPTGISVGDIIVKRHISATVSAVNETANEAFTSATALASPNGIQVLDNFIGYPFRDKVIGHFSLGGTQGSTNIAPTPTLILTDNGTISKTASFLYGKLSATGFSGSNFYTMTSPQYTYFDGNTRMQFSLWFYGTANTGANRVIANNFSSPSTGWIVSMKDSGAFITIYNNSSIYEVPYTVGKWNHLFVHLFDTKIYIYVNGVQSTIITSSINSLSQSIVFASNHTGAGTNLTSTDQLADLIFWYNASEFTADQVGQIYNKGNYRPFEIGSVRYRYQNPGVSGQKISAKVQLSRTTSAVSPVITKAGLLIS